MDVEKISAFKEFFTCHEVFQKLGVDNALYETLCLFDLILGGALRNIGLSPYIKEKIDLVELAKKRREGMPLEYIVELTNFMGHTYFCSSETFIPKEQTELLVKVALDFLRKKQDNENNLTIIDMATGCGNIAISILLNSNNTKVLASDISPTALDILSKNIGKFGLHDRISIFCGDLFSPFKGIGYEENIDMIICNPPYIPTNSLSKLSTEIVAYEPKIALDGGPFGIDFHRRIITDSLVMLKNKGVLVFEIGIGQKEIITRLFNNLKEFEDIRFYGDGAEMRVISAVKK